MPDSALAVSVYREARRIVVKNGYQWEIDSVDARKFEQITPFRFFQQYAWVVINAGMKNQVAEKIYERFMSKANFSAIGHEGKRKAIRKMYDDHKEVFEALHELYYVQRDIKQILDYLERLPWLGPITKYHMARNIGIDCAKPDRHLLRLAVHLEYSKDERDLDGVQAMCEAISKATGDRVGTVDVILWRFCNLVGWAPEPEKQQKSIESFTAPN